MMLKCTGRDNFSRKMKATQGPQQGWNRNTDTAALVQFLLNLIEVQTMLLIQKTFDELYICRIQSSISSLASKTCSGVVRYAVIPVICESLIDKRHLYAKNFTDFLYFEVLSMEQDRNPFFEVARYMLRGNLGRKMKKLMAKCHLDI